MTWRREEWVGAVKQSNLSTTVKAVARIYADYADPMGRSWVLRDTLCSEASVSDTSAKRALQALVRDGWLTVSERAGRGRSTLYLLRVPARKGGSQRPLKGGQFDPPTIRQVIASAGSEAS